MSINNNNNNNSNRYDDYVKSMKNTEWIAISLLIGAVYLGISSIFKSTIDNKEGIDKLINGGKNEKDKSGTTNIGENNGVVIIDPKGPINVTTTLVPQEIGEPEKVEEPKNENKEMPIELANLQSELKDKIIKYGNKYDGRPALTLKMIESQFVGWETFDQNKLKKLIQTAIQEINKTTEKFKI